MRELPKNIFATGIGTNVGKTIASAILVEALKADYWKPVQSGNTEGTDSEVVKSLVSNPLSRIHKEAYSFKAATVPSYAADLEGSIVETEYLASNTPKTSNHLIIEGAGGLMVHLRKDFMVIDLIRQMQWPVVLVSENYLGSINHTLLSIEALKNRNIDILGIIYSGERVEHMRELIYEASGIIELGSINKTEYINKTFVQQEAARLLSSLQKHFLIE